MEQQTFWIRERFPVVYEGTEAKAVLVDVDSFGQMEIIMDNLLNREEEPEDAVIAASKILQKVLRESRQTYSVSADWEQELDEL